VPVVPAVVLAVIALRNADPRQARVLAVVAALLVAGLPLVAAYLGLARPSRPEPPPGLATRAAA
jgi:phage shock protein PspC (stress-responsive transcriptional regulator)